MDSKKEDKQTISKWTRRAAWLAVIDLVFLVILAPLFGVAYFWLAEFGDAGAVLLLIMMSTLLIERVLVPVATVICGVLGIRDCSRNKRRGMSVSIASVAEGGVSALLTIRVLPFYVVVLTNLGLLG